MRSQSLLAKLSLMVLLFLGLSASAVSAQAPGGIEFFHGTYAEALAKAKKENKLVFVDAYTSWCGPCRFMSANVFPQPAVGEVFNKYYVNLKLDMEQAGDGAEFAKRYAVRQFPTLLFIRPDGTILHRELGGRDANAFIELSKKVQNMQ